MRALCVENKFNAFFFSFFYGLKGHRHIGALGHLHPDDTAKHGDNNDGKISFQDIWLNDDFFGRKWYVEK